MVKRSIEQDLRNRNFGARNGNYQNSVYKELQENVGSGKPTGSVRKETIAVSVTISASVQKQHSRFRLLILSCSRMREMRREPEVPEERVPVVECLDGPARITSKELAITHPAKDGILLNACSTKTRMVAVLGKSALTHTAKLMNNLPKGLKRMVTKVAMLKSTQQLGCAFQDVEPPSRSLHRFCGRAQTFRNQSDVFNSLKTCHVMLTFETKIQRSKI